MEYYVSPLERRRRKIRRIRNYGIAVLAAFVVGGGVYLFKELPIFELKRIAVTGLSGAEQQTFLAQVKSILSTNPWRRFLGLNHYFSWPRTLAAPNQAFVSLAVQKNFWERTVTLIAEKRMRYGIWCAELLPPARAPDAPPSLQGTDAAPADALAAPAATVCNWFDDKGIPFEEAPGAEGQLIPIIYEEAAAPPALGAPLLPNKEMNRLTQIISFLKTALFSSRELRLERKLEELRVKTTGDTVIRFSLRIDPAPSVFATLMTFLSTRVLRNFAYLDLTAPGKIYFKRK